MKKLTIFTLVIVFALFLSGCGLLDSLSDANKGFCEALGKLGAAAETAQGVDKDSTVEQLDEAKTGLTEAMEGVTGSAKNLKGVQMDKVQEAFDAMMDEIKGVSGDETLGDAAEGVKGAVTKFQAAYKVINTTVCAKK
jgi:hypothetical protein